MSRFFNASSSESDEEEDDIYARADELSDSQESDESDQYDDSDDSDDSDASDDSSNDGKTGASKFLVDSGDEDEDSDDDHEKGHIVKSAKDKRLEELESTAKAIENALKILDWTVVSSGKSSCDNAESTPHRLIFPVFLSQSSTS